jgi:UDP-N-acetylglucosamine 4-epimerase
MAKREQVVVYGDGSTSRDFCYVANVVQANILAATVAASSPVINRVVNIACGATTSLLQLQGLLREQIARVTGCDPKEIPQPKHEPFRKGDIPHSLADISLATEALGYSPTHTVEEGIAELVRAELSTAKAPVRCAL